MDSRQSDNSIVPMIASNAEGGKGVAKGYISARNLHRTQGRMNGGLTQSGKKVKSSFYDTFAISPLGSPVQESCMPGSTGGVPREGHVYQPKPHVRICEGLVSQGACLLD